MLCQNDIDSLLEFEETNRQWFEEHIGARPKSFYSRPAVVRHVEELLKAADANEAFPGIIEENGAILGRVNLTKMEGLAKARLGYRVAKSSVGRGVATYGVAHALRTGRVMNIVSTCAFVSLENQASHQVLRKHGFKPIAEHPNYAEVAGRLVTCIAYERSMA